MKCGTLCYATDQGLGILAKAFVDHGVVTHPLVIRHAHHPTHDEWYPGAPSVDIRTINSIQGRQTIEAFCADMNVMLFFETPFLWDLIPYCQRAGIKTAIMPMYECMPRVWPHQPDLVLNPSALDQRYHPKGVHIPVPVEVPWKLRTRAEVFVHNAGHGGLLGRNGTAELLEAMKYIRSPIRLILRSQKPISSDLYASNDPRIEYRHGTFPREELFATGDVLVFPEKFNGLSLPLQEARAAGVLVMGSNRFPMNEWLPTGPLIPVSGTRKSCVSMRCVEFDQAIIKPRDIAATIDQWYGCDIEAYSLSGKAWAESMSWENLKPRYLEVLCS